MQTVTYVRLWSDDAGESHFEDVTVELESIDFAPPAPPLWYKSVFDTTTTGFLVGETGWGGDIPHPTPRSQLICLLTGQIDITVSDGEQRSFRTGDIVHLDDLVGKGHVTRSFEQALCLAIGVATVKILGNS